ncbi:MAG: hypothetical protein GTN69_08620 [Armatimonadetes bacterium]|nr:hypothetical protein [Gemmatimonadales bacterium]NIO75927.1 hypothetical protein [Armatimonadota bacterium]
MREQFYGDSRDVSKWSVIAQLAAGHKVRNVLQVAMLRPDKPDTQGSTRHEPLYCHPAIKAFFDGERRIGVRDLRRVSTLPAHCNFGFGVDVVEEGFWGEGFGPYRAAYFRKVLARLAALSDPRLVLLDPDTGITTARYPRPEYVGVKELSVVYEYVSHGDVLLVYQHKPRFTRTGAEWWLKAEGLLRVAARESASVRSFIDDDVAFIAAVR